MRRPWPNPQHVLFGAVVALLVLSLLPTHWAALVSRPPRHLLNAAIAPADHLLKPLADALRYRPDSPVDLGNQEEYERARQQIVQLQFRLRQAKERIAELSQLRDQLKLVGVGLLPAAVTAWGGDRLHPHLTLNKGQRHGVRPGQVVVRGFTLVGRITDAGPVTSTVRLVTAADTHLVTLFKPPTPGQSARQWMARIQAAKGRDGFWAAISADDPVREGDLVHLYDDSWPQNARGFVIGKVTQIQKHPDDPILRRRVIVTPTRSLRHLDHVTVIVPTGASDLVTVDP